MHRHLDVKSVLVYEKKFVSVRARFPAFEFISLCYWIVTSYNASWRMWCFPAHIKTVKKDNFRSIKKEATSKTKYVAWYFSKPFRCVR